jgi:hypothetical protein
MHKTFLSIPCIADPDSERIRFHLGCLIRNRKFLVKKWKTFSGKIFFFFVKRRTLSGTMAADPNSFKDWREIDFKKFYINEHIKA